jgi:nitroreductase
MDVYETMRSTRATRSYASDPVDERTLARVLDHARFAPSGGNRQPWRVIVVRDPGQKRRLRDEYVTAYRAMGIEGAADLDDFAEHLDEVPLLLVICVELAALSISDERLDRPSIVGGASIYPFVQNVLLGLAGEGLAGLLSTVVCPREPQLREIFGIPEEFAVACVIPVGHPQRRPGRANRRPVEEFARLDRFEGSSLSE